MSQLFHRPRTGDTITVPDELVDRYAANPDWEGVGSTSDSSDLKGAALDQALEDAGLPKTGSADEKRARLAEHTATTEEQS